MMGTRLPVRGVGTVSLPVQRVPGAQGPGSQATLELRTVLHVPSAMCNIIGPLGDDGYSATVGNFGNRQGYITDCSSDDDVAYFVPGHSLLSVKLMDPPSGPVVGPSVFSSSGHYLIHALWSDDEQRRWMDSRPGVTVPPNGTRSSNGDGGADELDSDNDSDSTDGSAHAADDNFTHEELDFIEMNWGNTRDFMICHGLKFYNEEDCDKAKAVIRSFMADEDDC
jgi:hypothetical protein